MISLALIVFPRGVNTFS